VIRWIYSAAWYLALPVVVLRLWWRGRHEPGYRQHIAERLGFYSGAPYALRKQPVIWVHAVSVGETRAAEPLVDALLRDYPDHVILLTHMTPTGRATGKALFASYAGRVVQCYLPYDIGSMARRFLQHFSPQVCILMETEVWPNTVAQCVRQGVPVALVNARLSARSLAKGQRLATLMGEAARSLTCVAAQTEADAARLEELGVRNPHVTGSIKFDVEPPANAVSDGAALRFHFGRRPVLLCASTREGEEALILDALRNVDLGDTLLLIVPRHPQRGAEVAALAAGRPVARRSRDEALPEAAGVWVADTLGELGLLYAATGIAFVGGSLVAHGGQNVLEPARLGCAVAIGPHAQNFAEPVAALAAAGALTEVAGGAALAAWVSTMLDDPPRRAAAAAAGQATASQHAALPHLVAQTLAALLTGGAS